MKQTAVGFFGTLAALLVLPRLLRFTLRRFSTGVLLEVATIVLSGLLTEKAVGQLRRRLP